MSTENGYTYDARRMGVDLSARPILREEHDPGPEWPQFVREEKIAARAHERHLARVAYAERVVFEALWADETCTGSSPDDLDGPSSDETIATGRRYLRAACLAEAHGLGGPRGYMGGATERAEWATRLGAGRHNAGDGPAWDAALEAAFEGADPSPLDFAALLNDDFWPDAFRWVEAYASYQAVNAHDCATAHAWDEVREAAASRREAVEHETRQCADECPVTPRELAAAVATPGPVIEIVSRRAPIVGQVS